MRDREVIFNEAKAFFRHLKDTNQEFREQLKHPHVYKIGIQNLQVDIETIEKEVKNETLNKQPE
jgi:hypothetical protein